MEACCPHCGGSQLIDAGVLPAAGGNLTCRACGDDFWARTVPRQNDSGWFLRRRDGSRENVSDMASLVALLRDGRASLEDEISRTGDSWRRLAEIVELATMTPGAAVGADAAEVIFGRGPESAELDGPTMTLEVQPLGGRVGSATHKALSSWKLGTKSIVVFLLALVIGGLSTVLVMRSQLERQARANEVARMLEQVSGLLQNGRRQDIASAVELTEHILITSPNHAEAAAWLAMARWTEADLSSLQVLLLEETLGREPGNGVDQQGEARLDLLRQVEVTRLEEAFLAARGALKFAPDSITANFVLAAYHLRRESREDYARHLTRIKLVDPNHWSRHYFEALQIGAAGEGAIRAYQQLLVKEPNHNPVRARLALLLREHGEVEQALAEVTLIQERANGHEVANMLMDVIAYTKPEPGKEVQGTTESESLRAPAEVEVQLVMQDPEVRVVEAVSITGKTPSAENLVERARGLRAKGKTEKALRVYERALLLTPHDPEALTGIGWCHFDSNQWAEAEDNFARALSQAPRFPQAHFGMAEIARVRGLASRAQHFYSTYLEIVPNGERSALVRKRMKELERAQ